MGIRLNAEDHGRAHRRYPALMESYDKEQIMKQNGREMKLEKLETGLAE